MQLSRIAGWIGAIILIASRVRKCLQDRDGITTLEYTVIMAAIAVLVMVVLAVATESLPDFHIHLTGLN